MKRIEERVALAESVEGLRDAEGEEEEDLEGEEDENVVSV